MTSRSSSLARPLATVLIGGLASVACAALNVGVTGAQAAPMEWTVASGGNGHFYESIVFTGTWSAARADALSRSHNTQPGYLVTLTSAGEQAFLIGIGVFSSGWIGGTDGGTEGEWLWADGPEAGVQFWSGGPNFGAPGTPPNFYAPWHGGDPSGGLSENYAYLQAGGWNDFPGAPFTTATYFIEYGGSRVSNRIPEPVTLGLFGAGLAGIGLVRRRTRCANA